MMCGVQLRKYGRSGGFDECVFSGDGKVGNWGKSGLYFAPSGGLGTVIYTRCTVFQWEVLFRIARYFSIRHFWIGIFSHLTKRNYEVDKNETTLTSKMCLNIQNSSKCFKETVSMWFGSSIWPNSSEFKLLSNEFCIFHRIFTRTSVKKGNFNCCGFSNFLLLNW